MEADGAIPGVMLICCCGCMYVCRGPGNGGIALARTVCELINQSYKFERQPTVV